MERKETRKYKYYLCGQCNTKIEYSSDEQPPDECPDCGWKHKEVEKYSLPPTIKLDLSQY